MPTGLGEDRRRLIPSLIDVFQGHKEPFAVNIEGYRDILHASDVAKGFITMLLSNAEGTFNVSSGKPTAIRQIVQELAALCGGDPWQVMGLQNKGTNEPRLLVGDSSQLKEEGWIIEGIELQDILSEALMY